MQKTLEIKNLNEGISFRSGKKLVFGSGNLNTKIIFVGEAPGRAEEILGKPFVGRAGRLLDAALKKAGISRDDVYITNVVKFRPIKDGKNRKPSKKEIAMFLSFLLKELKIIKPRLVCVLGATALEALTGRKEITKLRGKIIEKDEYKILPTFHPAAVLRNPNRKRDFFSDIAKLKKVG